MKSKRKQILISSLLMLIVAAMALTSTTFAWFTTSTTGTVDDFEFTATDASGIQLSVDAENWKSTIKSTDIATQVTGDTAHTAKAQTGSLFTGEVDEFIPLSTHADTASSSTYTEKGRLAMFKTEASDKDLKAIASNTDNYYVFNIYVNNLSNLSKDLQLKTFSVSGVTGADNNTQMASRVAFIDEGSISKDSGTAENVKTAVISTNKAISVTILEPNSKSHTGFAQTYHGVGATKQTYYGIKAEGTYAVSNGFIMHAANVAEVTTIDEDTTQADSKVAILDGNSITKITVYVWIEGQDIDCNNDVASGKVCVNFTFESNESASTYEVKYDANGTTAQGVSGTVPAIKTYEPKTTVNVTFPDPEEVTSIKRTDYTFLGWSSNKNASTPEFAKGAKESFYITNNITLYAVWAKNPKLTYNVNGGTVTDTDTWNIPDEKTYAYNENATIKFPTEADLTKANAMFKGWSKTQDGAVEFAEGATEAFNITADTTLYAVWANTYTVTYDGNGNTAGAVPAVATVEAGITHTVAWPTDLEKTGKVFIGWSTISGATTPLYTKNSAFTVNGDTTLYAVWADATQTVNISYNGNGNTSGTVPASSTPDVGSTYTVLDNTDLENTGYTFSGWNTKADGTGTTYVAGNTFYANENTTLYAIWTPEE